MRKLLIRLMTTVLTVLCLFLFSSCKAHTDTFYVSADAADLITEDFGIAVTKGNTTLLEAINEVVDAWVSDGTMTAYVDYYTELAKYLEDNTLAKPDAGNLKTSWDFGAATETITVFTESGFAPFEFLSGNEVIGVDIAIMNQVAANMGKRVVIKDVAFDSIATSVSAFSGDAAGAAGMSITEERKKSVDFSDIYYSSTLVIVSSEENGYDCVKNLSGLKVGVQEGTSGDLIISDAKTESGAQGADGIIFVDSSTTVKQYKQYALAFADLKAGRIDAILMDKLPAQTMLSVVQ